ncbi:MAG: hydroxyethylthiazole kinase [Desulfobacterales bacterium]
MILAAKTANDKNIPVVLDPVGSGATSLRTRAVKKIMKEVTARAARQRTGISFLLASPETSDDTRTRGVDLRPGHL